MSIEKKRIKTIEWAISNACNYNCSYCLLGKSKIVTEKIEIENYDIVISNLRKLKGSYNIVMSGCEPLIIVNLPDIISEIVNKTEHTISICTNFSSSANKIISLLNIAGDRFSWMSASLHLERCNIKDFFLKAKKVNEYLLLKYKRLMVVSVAIKNELKYLEKIGEKFLRAGIAFNLQPLKLRNEKSGEYTFLNYSSKEKEIIKKFKREYGLKKVNFNNKICYSGIDYIVIYSGGDVFRCHPALVFGKNKEGYLGNIFNNTFRIWEKPQRCIYKICDCVNPSQKNMIKKS